MSLWLTGLFLRLKQSNVFEALAEISQQRQKQQRRQTPRQMLGCRDGWVHKGVAGRPLLREHRRLCWLSPKTVRRTMRPSIAGSHLVGLQLTDPFLSFPLPLSSGQDTSASKDISSVQGAAVPGTLFPFTQQVIHFSPDLKFIFADESRLFPPFWPSFRKLVPYPQPLFFVLHLPAPAPAPGCGRYCRLLHLLASPAEPHKSRSRHFAYLLKLKYVFGRSALHLADSLYLFIILKVFLHILFIM